MNVQDINIGDIVVRENVRVSSRSSRVVELMDNIKQHGLKQPIGVAVDESGKYVFLFGYRRLMACKKLGWKTIPANVHEKSEASDCIIINLIENLQREDISPVELGRSCEMLKKIGLNEKEIAVRLSIPGSRVSSALRAFYDLPEKFRDRVKFIPRGWAKSKSNVISATVANRVLQMKTKYKLSEHAVEKLLTDAGYKNMTVHDMEIVGIMLDAGYTQAQAMSELTRHRTYRLDIVANVDEIDSLLKKYNESSAITLLTKIMYGEIPPIHKPKFVKFESK